MPALQGNDAIVFWAFAGVACSDSRRQGVIFLCAASRPYDTRGTAKRTQGTVAAKHLRMRCTLLGHRQECLRY